MVTTKHLLFLLLTSFVEANTTVQTGTTTILNFNANSSFEQIFDANSSLDAISQGNLSLAASENQVTNAAEEEESFDNNYAVQLPPGPDVVTEEFHSGPHYEASWTFIDKETVRVVFCLFSLSKFSHPKNHSYKSEYNSDSSSTMVSATSRSIRNIHSFKYFLFTIRQYKTNTEIVRNMTQLIVKASPDNEEYFSNSLKIVRLNPMEKYAVCIYYYRMNLPTQPPDLLICQDIIHNHQKHSAHDLIFIALQYSICLLILILLHVIFVIRKRRVAQFIHQHLVSKAQRIRSTLSLVNLGRQQSNPVDSTINEQKCTKPNGILTSEKNKLTKRIISSPAIVLNEPSTPAVKTTQNPHENEPFLKLANGKNHVHFLLGLDEEDEDDECNDDFQPIHNDTKPEPPVVSSAHTEPYGDRSDALLSMAHILDTNKPWSRYNQDNIP